MNEIDLVSLGGMMSDDGDVGRLLRRIREMGRQRLPGRWPWDERTDKPGRVWDEVPRKPKTWDEGREDRHGRR